MTSADIASAATRVRLGASRFVSRCQAVTFPLGSRPKPSPPPPPSLRRRPPPPLDGRQTEFDNRQPACAFWFIAANGEPRTEEFQTYFAGEGRASRAGFALHRVVRPRCYVPERAAAPRRPLLLAMKRHRSAQAEALSSPASVFAADSESVRVPVRLEPSDEVGRWMCAPLLVLGDSAGPRRECGRCQPSKTPLREAARRTNCALDSQRIPSPSASLSGDYQCGGSGATSFVAKPPAMFGTNRPRFVSKYLLGALPI